MGHPHLVAVFLIFASVTGIVNFAVYPVFSQTQPTTISITPSFNMTTQFNRTVTVVSTYQTTGFTTSSSFFTQIMVAFVTSTTFYTYIQVTFTSSTSTVAYPAPSARLRPNSGPPQVKLSEVAAPRLIQYGGNSFMLVVLLMSIFGFVKRRRTETSKLAVS